MKKMRVPLLILCFAILLFTNYVSHLTLPDTDETPSAQASPTASPEPTPEPTPEPSPDTDDLDVLALRAEEGEILPKSLLLAPAELSEVLEGNLTGYARLRVDGWVFEWLESDYWKQGEELNAQEEKLVISGGSAGQTCQILEMWDYSNWDVEADRKLVYLDADFDGIPDILVCTGHHGNQGALTYHCFLQRDDGFEECTSFTNITNPAIDGENQLILGSWRNWAASHSWGMYAYQDGEYVMTHVLTEEPAPDSPTDDIIWQWTADGKVIGRSDELTDEEIHDLLYNENSDWGILTDRWRAIYNNGLMADYSIYSE